MERRLILSTLLAFVVFSVAFSSPYVNVSSTPCTDVNDSKVKVDVGEGQNVNSVTVSLLDENSLMSENTSKVIFFYGFDFREKALPNRTLTPFDEDWSCYGVRLKDEEGLSEPLTYAVKGDQPSYIGVIGKMGNSKNVALFSLDNGEHRGYERENVSFSGNFYPIYYSSDDPGGVGLNSGFNLDDPSTNLDFFELPRGNYTISVTLTTESGSHHSDVETLEVKRDSEDFEVENVTEVQDTSPDYQSLYLILIFLMLFSAIAWFAWRDFRES